jgi:membrane protease subunit (stomatin/prohibitin family)
MMVGLTTAIARGADMALMDFIKKQFIDIIQWTEEGDGTLAWRFPMAGMEIQNGGTLVVRESQMAMFVNEGQVADVFGPGTYKLTTQTLPVLTYLKNWDKLFESPFKSDVYFFSTRQQIDQKWGTPQPITIRDKDFGAVRLRAFGNYAFRIADPKLFHTEISGTRDSTPWPTWTASCAAGAAEHQQRHRASGMPSWTWRPTR